MQQKHKALWHRFWRPVCMKRFLFIVVVAMMFAACGNDSGAKLEDPSGTQPPSEAIPDSMTIVNDSAIVPDAAIIRGDTTDTTHQHP